MKKNILRRVAVVLTACALAMGTGVGTMTFLTPTVVHAEEEYLYYATLDISFKGWKSYNTGLNYNLSGGTAGKIYRQDIQRQSQKSRRYCGVYHQK